MKEYTAKTRLGTSERMRENENKQTSRAVTSLYSAVAIVNENKPTKNRAKGREVDLISREIKAGIKPNRS